MAANKAAPKLVPHRHDQYSNNSQGTPQVPLNTRTIRNTRGSRNQLAAQSANKRGRREKQKLALVSYGQQAKDTSVREEHDRSQLHLQWCVTDCSTNRESVSVASSPSPDHPRSRNCHKDTESPQFFCVPLSTQHRSTRHRPTRKEPRCSGERSRPKHPLRVRRASHVNGGLPHCCLFSPRTAMLRGTPVGDLTVFLVGNLSEASTERKTVSRHLRRRRELHVHEVYSTSSRSTHGHYRDFDASDDIMWPSWPVDVSTPPSSWDQARC